MQGDTHEYQPLGPAWVNCPNTGEKYCGRECEKVDNAEVRKPFLANALS